MADLSWSDCGRKTKAQNLYSGKGRKGRRMVGGCGRNETKTSLYAHRLPKIWKRLFKMKYGRAPSEMETWVAIRTGKIAENVRDWEKQALVDKTGGKKRRINLGARGVPYSKILSDWLAKERAEQAEKQRLQDEEDARLAVEQADLKRRGAIMASSEVPREMLVRIAKGESGIHDAVQTIYGITSERISTLMEAFGFTK